MKSISKFFVFVLTTYLFINVFAINIINAQPVDSTQAKLVAKNFFADILSRSKISNTKGLSFQEIEMALIHEEKGTISNPNDQKKGSQTLSLYYIFNVKDKTNPKDKNGFIIISGDQRVPAILGYSFTEEFSENDQAPAFIDWMDHFKEQITFAIQNNLTPDTKISDNWKKYSGTFEVKGSEQLTEAPIMLTTKWSQRSYYNNLCPADADISCGSSLNHHVPAGCAAVAMAQIMNKHEYPAANNPIPGYIDPLTVYDFTGSPKDGTSISYGSIPAIAATTYDWANMVDDINISSPIAPLPEQINAVSTLIYHCGVALQMDYGPPNIGSGAGSPLNAFVEYFKYSTSIQEIVRSDYSDIDWTSKLKTELDNSRPVYYAGYKNEAMEGGHAFVCDGYQDVDPGSQGRFFHFNWGGGSVSTGVYFNLDNLTLGIAPNEKVYTYKQWAIIGIAPGSGSISTISDADGNQYNTVTIGEQTWMVGNLKTTKYNNGTAIGYPGTDKTAWQNNNSGAYSWWGNNEANKNMYGALYNWYAIDKGNLCPDGWHVPTFNEWLDLFTFLGGGDQAYGRTIAGGILKEKGTAHWASPNSDASDTYGFTALPGGNRNSMGDYFHLDQGTYGLWWASGYWWADNTQTYGTSFMMSSTSAGVPYGRSEKNVGYSVRCLKGPLVEIIPGDAGAFAYGDIGAVGKEHWYKFLTSAAGDYAIQTFGSTDTYMYLYNSDQTTLLAEDNDGAGAGNSKIVQNLNTNRWYYVKVKGNGNSTGSYSIGVSALPAPPLADNVTINYDGLSHDASTSVPSGISIVWYDAATGGNVILAPSGRKVGTYTAWAEAVNSSGSKSALRTHVTLTINPASLTIKANNATKYCGQKNPVFSVLFFGFVNGENESLLSGTLSFNSTANEDSGVGTYSITPSGLTSGNYDITFMPGIIMINEVSIDASASSKPVPVGSSSITLTSKVLNASSNPVPDVKVWFSIENGNNQITNYPAIFTDGSGNASLTLNGLTSMVDIFKVTAIAGSGCGNGATSIAYLAVYDPDGGFVTGGGWINSPDGALVGTHLTGKANFGFVSKYKKGSNVPDGNTEFQFHEGNLNFSSSSYDLGSLVIAGYKAIYKGLGTINGTGSYRFMVSAVDGDVANGGGYDKFRIKIWNKTDGAIIYDNNIGKDDNDIPTTTLGGGSIVIHMATDKATKSSQMTEFGLKVYPNPFTDHIYFDLQLEKDSKVSLEIFDISGTKLATVYNDVVFAFDHYQLEYTPQNVKSVLLFYRLTVDGQLMFNGSLIHY
jgi:uncharacterized protein (TIGR02145 family)